LRPRSKIRIQGLGFRVSISEVEASIKNSDLGFMVYGLGFRVSISEVEASIKNSDQNQEFRVEGLGLRV